jgi:hypothetical protein
MTCLINCPVFNIACQPYIARILSMNNRQPRLSLFDRSEFHRDLRVSTFLKLLDRLILCPTLDFKVGTVIMAASEYGVKLMVLPGV